VRRPGWLKLGGLSILALLIVSCSDGSGESSGRVPDPVPDEFPIYSPCEIGATQVDHEANRTWFEMDIDDDVESVVRFYTVELVNVGYLVPRIEEIAPGSWVIEFRAEELLGFINVEAVGDGSSTLAVVEVNRS
jgi:hypothetical protein